MVKESLGDIIRTSPGWDGYIACYGEVERYCQWSVDALTRQAVWRNMEDVISNSVKFGLRIDKNGYLVQLE